MSLAPSVEKHSATNSPPSLEEVRGELGEVIGRAYLSSQPELIDALPGMGKSHTAIKVAASLDIDLLILTERGWEGRYDELKDWCGQEGLDHAIAPSLDEHCPTVRGEHGATWEDRVKDLREAGISAGEIHNRAEEWFDEEIPCQIGDECKYSTRWERIEDADVIIGYYSHANVNQLREDRVIAIDEFPGVEYLEKVSGEAVSQFLESCDDIPVDSRTELLRNGDEVRSEIHSWFRGKGRHVRAIDSAVEGVLEGNGGHALAPLAALTILEAEPATSGWERADLGFRQVGVHAKEEKKRLGYNEGDVGVLDPPDFSDAKGLVALDGTPTKRLWEEALGLSFNRRRVLSERERLAYIRETQRLRVIQTSEAMRPYSSGTYVDGERNAAILHELAENFDSKAGFITSSAGKRQTPLDEVSFDEKSEDVHYGNFKGSNDFADIDVGAIFGCSHWGDQIIHLWGAIAGEATKEERGQGEEYGSFGSRIVRHMREHEVAQAVFRFSRRGEGGLVFVDTSAIPVWMPVEVGPEECKIDTWTSRQQQAIRALERRGASRASEITEAMEIDVSRQGAWNIGNRLVDEGIARKRDDPSHSQAKLLELTDPDETNPFGTVTLPEVSEGNCKVARKRDTITSNFTVTRGNLKEAREAWERKLGRRERAYRQLEMKRRREP